MKVVSALVKSLELLQTVLSSLMAHQADGQYQAKKFLQRLKSSTQGENQALPEGHDIFFVIPWEHWSALAGSRHGGHPREGGGGRDIAALY